MRLFPRRKYFRQSHVVKFPPYRKEIRHVTVYGRFSRCLDILEEAPIFPGNVYRPEGLWNQVPNQQRLIITLKFLFP